MSDQLVVRILRQAQAQLGRGRQTVDSDARYSRDAERDSGRDEVTDSERGRERERGRGKAKGK